ncbi:MAG: hypothetical protein MK207_08435 [Saprospiraceae bacterium]|nr:hypothetical protein [Saprospiraceae bacterium]
MSTKNENIKKELVLLENKLKQYQIAFKEDGTIDKNEQKKLDELKEIIHECKIKLNSTEPQENSQADISNVNAAEIQRLREELVKLAGRNVPVGVNRTYKQYIALGGDEGEIHKCAAEAARVTGNMAAFLKRANAAKKKGVDTTGLFAELESYVKITISSTTQIPKSNKKKTSIGAPTLNIKVAPFHPCHKKAIEFADKKLQEKWSFRGFLPFGEYTLEHEGRKKEFELNNQCIQTKIEI